MAMTKHTEMRTPELLGGGQPVREDGGGERRWSGGRHGARNLQRGSGANDLCECSVPAVFLAAADRAGAELVLVDMMGARLAHPETWTCRCCGFAVAHREPRAASLTRSKVLNVRAATQ